jgi:hypothetical protein
VETYGRMELEELQGKLLQERAELKARVDAESKNSTSLTQYKRNLEDERDAKMSSMKAPHFDLLFYPRRQELEPCMQ